MVSSDFKDFSDMMLKVFDNYPAAKIPCASKISEWFEELKGFSFFTVRQAFRKYQSEKEFPPTIAAIISNSKKSFVSDAKQPCMVKIGIHPCGANSAFNMGANDKVFWVCESCYEKSRPKSDSEKILDERLAKLRQDAINAGCKTAREYANYTRSQMGMRPLPETPNPEQAKKDIAGLFKKTSPANYRHVPAALVLPKTQTWHVPL